MADSKLNHLDEIRFLEFIAPLMYGDLWASNKIDFSTCTSRQLEMALNDTAGWGRCLSKSDIERIDQNLDSADLPTLSSMMDSTYRKALQIVRAGHLKSNDEFRLLNSFVSEVDSTSMSDSDKNNIQKMLDEYEKAR